MTGQARSFDGKQRDQSQHSQERTRKQIKETDTLELWEEGAHSSEVLESRTEKKRVESFWNHCVIEQ